MEEFLVIKKSWLEDRISNYTEYRNKVSDPHVFNNYSGIISELETILITQNRPLQPLLEDAYNTGGSRSYFESLEGYESWAKEEADKHPTLEQYLENLKIQ